MTAEPLHTHMVDDRLAKRNAVVLAIGQALGGAQASIVIATGGLVGVYLLADDKSLATLPVTTFLAGIALGVAPAALITGSVGRRLGFMIGAAFGIAGGLTAVQAIFANAFWLFSAATFIGGIAGAFVHQYRFAAADVASEDFKPKAISWVLAGGVFAGIVGPQTVIAFKDLFLPIEFAGAFVGQAVLMVATLFLMAFVTLPKPASAKDTNGGRPLKEILAQPKFIASAGCAITSYALMSFVMTATPLAMVTCGFTPGQATLAIQWHIIAMFAPSFFTGNLINRFGKTKIVSVGLLLLSGCATVSLMGIDLANFNIALILLGLGWNFGFIGATAMVTECYRPEERSKAQAANDFIIFGCVGFASLMSGFVFEHFGWAAVNTIVFPFVILAFLLLAWLSKMDAKADPKPAPGPA